MNVVAEPPRLAGPGFRWAMVSATLALWMALGWVLRTDANTYLLLGVPLVVVFQLAVARRPLTELWFAEGSTLVPPWWGWLISAGFMVWPLYELLTFRNPGSPVRLWLCCAVIGAIPAGWSVARATRDQWRDLLLCAALAGVMATVMLGAGYFMRPHHDGVTASRLLYGVRSLCLYIPVCFVLEEVFFRGALDSYLNRGKTGMDWMSAAVLSVLWGWWHLPIVPARPDHPVAQFVGLLLALPLAHAGIGVAFSYFWRRSGLLLVPAFAHAFIDAIRNALQ
jgi:membrane protease YdiL (CAAX protease family)